MKNTVKHIHFIGIAGAGMSGIATVLQQQNYLVSGSDLQDSATLQQLSSLGIKTYVGHSAENLVQADVVVVSSAIKADNVELLAAKKRAIPVVARAAMLAELMRFKYGIAVAGTHGKTTTTSLITAILLKAGLDPTYIIGGKINGFKQNAQHGAGKYLVAEADESDASFLYLQPMLAVTTNIEADHMQTYANDFAQLRQTFIDFLQKIPFYGSAVVCTDDATVRGIVEQLNCQILSYGIKQPAKLMAKNIRAVGSQMHFSLVRAQYADLPIQLNLAGQHNVLNALAAIGIASLVGVADAVIQQALSEFSGVKRRFQRYPDVECSNGGKAIIIDDYAHHPTELMASIATARQVFSKQRLVVAFQPHRYSRTADCFAGFVNSLALADVVLVTQVYAAGEEPIAGADGIALVKALQTQTKVPTFYAADLINLTQQLSNQLQAGDVLLCMGAGSISQLAAQVVENMENKHA